MHCATVLLQAFLAWPYSYMRAAYGGAPGIPQDLRAIFTAAGQHWFRRAPKNKRLMRLLQAALRMQIWSDLLERLRAGAGKSWANLRAARR